MVDATLAVSSFIAGILTFLAPCTLPLVPGYLGFISGVSIWDIQDPKRSGKARRKIMVNGLLYTLGFSVVFIILGTLVGLGGQQLVQYRLVLGRIGGAVIIVFGLYMMHIFRIPFLRVMDQPRRIPGLQKLRPGTPLSSMLFGATFAFGWTPCIGPVLGSILILAASSLTVWQGTLLLAIFSVGLALPFWLVAGAIGWMAPRLRHIGKYLEWVSVVGGAFLVFLGVLLATNHLEIWTSYFFDIFGFISYETLLRYL
ncbi:MAG: cytochrome c biogenesis protein CcdA [Candidatus Andersenbacteria bacterium]